ELNLMDLVGLQGLDLPMRLEESPERKTGKTVDDDLRQILKTTGHFLKPIDGEVDLDSIIGKNDWVQVPLPAVARSLAAKPAYHYWLPPDGAPMELGLFAIGSKAVQPELALELIDELISTPHALEAYRRMKKGMVQSSLMNAA